MRGIPLKILNMGPDFPSEATIDQVMSSYPVAQLMWECSIVEEILERIFEYN